MGLLDSYGRVQAWWACAPSQNVRAEQDTFESSLQLDSIVFITYVFGII